jgi:chaperonin cofactor prefoldin
MKKLGILMSLGLLIACNNTATLENKADSLGKKVDSLSQKAWDSGKKDVKELKEKIEDQFKKKDSADK